MRRYFLLIMVLIFTASCSRPDFDTSVQVQAWLESIDPNANVIEVWCKADVEVPPGSGKWVKGEFTDQVSASEVLAGSGNRGLEWPDIVSRTIEIVKTGFADYYVEDLIDKKMLTLAAAKTFIAKFKNASCDGKALRTPPIQVPRCPNDTSGCDQPPDPLDQPQLPPPPPPGGGGDF